MHVHTEDRRGFFKHGLVFLGAVAAGGFAWSALRFVSSGRVRTSRSGGPSGIFEQDDAASGAPALSCSKNSDGSWGLAADAIPEGAFGILAIAGAPRICVNSGGAVRVFDATCSHLGCLVKWDEATRQFLCPCHGGKYDANGRVLAGPPPAPLREHQVEVVKNDLKIHVA